MHKLPLRITCIAIFFISILFTQKKIEIIGNDKTKSHIITQEFKNINLDSLSNNDLILYQNKLLELELFNEVSILPTDSSYIIIVSEKPNFEPMPLIERNETLGWSYGVGFKFNNINGLNKKIKFNTLGGAIESYQISYFSPNLLNKQYPFFIDLYKTTQGSVEDNYMLNKYNLSTSLFTKKINNLNNCEFTLALFDYTLHFNDNNQSENFKGLMPSIAFNKNVGNNSLNLNVKYHYYNKSDYDNYLNINLNNIYKMNLDKNDQIYLNFKNSININFSKNIPEYNKIYIGGEDGIRAYEENPLLNDQEIQNKLKTQNLLLSSIEFALPLWEHYLSKTHLLLFFDYALYANQYNKFDLKNHIYGYGFGLKNKFFNNQILNVYIGINPNGNKVINFVVETN